MGDVTNISWANHTFNGWRGCEHAELDGAPSAECAFCYAEQWAKRNPTALGVWGAEGTRVLAKDAYWRNLTKWYANALKDGVCRRVFCSSLADVFEAPKSLSNADVVMRGRKRLFDAITSMPLVPRADGLQTGLVFMLLTKRATNIARMVPSAWLTPDNAPSQVWYGTSVGNQQAANERIPHMVDLQQRTNNRTTLFFSFEPLLGAVDVNKALGLSAEQRHTMLAGSWFLIGGESGSAEKVRALDIGWAESLMAQAQAMGAYRHMKQRGRLWYDQKRHEGIRSACVVPVDGTWRWVDQKHKKGGDPSEWPDHLRVRELPCGYAWDTTSQESGDDAA